MSTIRTFIAVETSPDVRSRAAGLINKLRRCDAKIGWVAPENMHLTLKFLGEVNELQIHEVCQAVTAAASSIAPFDFCCQGAGAFPNPARPRTLWLGVTDGSDQLCALHEAIEAAMANIGYRREGRRFRPHLTIGRVRRTGPGIHELAQLIDSHADFQAGVTGVDEVIVFSSELTPEGPIYRAVGRAELTGRTNPS